MEVLIENRQNRHRLSKQKIQKTAASILNGLGYPDAQLSILVVDDTQMAEINRAYLNHAGPTNVISFPIQEGQFSHISPDLLGDVVISADTADREAVEAGMQMSERFNQLLVHGILHLIGYDHVNSEQEAAVMERKSNQLMQLIQEEE
jgi:probable rRNA maturation factor